MSADSLHSGELIKRLNGILEKRANKSLNEDGVTFSQMKLLCILEKDGSLTLKELEKYFCVAQATIAGIVVRLEKKGLIESFYSPEDKRAKHICLTEDGVRMCEHARCSMERNEQWLLASLNEDEKKELHRLLQKIYDDVNM